MTVRLSILQARVYFIVKDHGPIGPSNIGQALDFKYEQASGSVARPLAKLVDLGLCEKVEKNKRVVKYRVRDGIEPAFEIKSTSEDDPWLDRLRKRVVEVHENV